jgi:hypothetical protein
MKSLLLSLTMAASLGLPIAGCDDDPAGPAAIARLRAIHASPDAPAVDIYVDGARVAANVPYKAITSYLEVPAGSRNVQVRAAGTSTTVIDANVTLSAGTDYTVLAAGRVANIAPLVLTDTNTAPVAGNVRVRLVHGAPTAGTVDIYVTAPNADIATIAPTLAGVPFRGFSPYLSVPAGSYRVRVTPAGSKTVAIDSGTLTLTTGQIRTGVALENAGGGAPFTAQVYADN